MTRGSRHRSRRSHREPSESGDGGGGGGDEDVEIVKFYRDPEPERRKSGGESGHAPGDSGRKRKERVDESDRWVGNSGDGASSDKRVKGEVFGPVDIERDEKDAVKAEKTSKSSRSLKRGEERADEVGKGPSEKERDKDAGRQDREKDYVRMEGEDAREKDSGRREKDSGKKDKEEREKELVQREHSGHHKGDREKEASKREHTGQHKDEKERDARKESGHREEKASSRREHGSQHGKDEKDRGSSRREHTSYYKDDRDSSRYSSQYEKEMDRDRKEKDSEREKERDGEKKEREREKEHERERERVKEHLREEREREREKERDRDYDRDKERDWERERALEKDRRDTDVKNERYEDTGTRKRGLRPNKIEEAHLYMTDVEMNDKYNGITADKEHAKHQRRKSNDAEKDKWTEDGRANDDRKHKARDSDYKSRSYKDQKVDSDKYKEKYRDDADRRQGDDKHLDECSENADRNKKHRDEKRRDERLSRDHANDRDDYKNKKDGNRSAESNRNDKVHESDAYNNALDDYGSKYRGRKRRSDDLDNHIDLKSQVIPEHYDDAEKSAVSRLDSFDGRNSGYREDADYDLSKRYSKGSPSSGHYEEKDQTRHRSKISDSAKKEFSYEDRNRGRASSAREHTPASRHRDRDSDNWSVDKLKQNNDRPRDVPMEGGSSQYDHTPKKDNLFSPNRLTDKSPSSGDQRLSGRVNCNRSLDAKSGPRGGFKYKERETEASVEKPNQDDRVRGRVGNREASVGGSASAGRNSIPPPPARYRNDDFPFFEEDNRGPAGERRFHGLQKRNDHGHGRGQGGSWKNSPNWPSAVANGFMSLQHGPHSGFAPTVHQFPGPTMFNMRPSMKLGQGGLPYPMHEGIDRYSGHVRHFGWPNSLDDSVPPHLQVWNNGVFGGDPYMYGRQEWENRPQTGSRGWEMAVDASKGPNDMINAEALMGQKEHDAVKLKEPPTGQPSPMGEAEDASSEPLAADATEAKDGALLEQSAAKALSALEPTAVPKAERDSYQLRAYLSRICLSSTLVDTELYKKCTELGALDDSEALDSIGNKHFQNALKDDAASRGASLNIIASVLPARGSIFERALVLSKSKAVHVLRRVAVPPAEIEQKLMVDKLPAVENYSPHKSVCLDTTCKDEMPEVVKPEGSLAQNPLPALESNDNCMLDVPQVSGEVDTSISTEDAFACDAGKGDMDLETAEPSAVADSNAPANLEVVKHSFVSDSADVVAGRPPDCEAIVAAVNLSRIPNSPESTH